LEAFAKFGSDLDAVTLNVIGRRNVEILNKVLNDPYTVEEDQVAIIYAGSKIY
jgi:F-type H+-transporting ATPase subunit alpha